MSFNPFDDRPYGLKSKLALTYTLLILVNGVAWTWAFIAFFNWPTLLSTALLASTFGLRHAFDADHIAAIDNVVRKLMQEGKLPYSAGFFFLAGSLDRRGASAPAVKDRLDAFDDAGGGVIDALPSGRCSCWSSGSPTCSSSKAYGRRSPRVRHGGTLADEDLVMLLAGRGFLARIFRPLFSVISRSWQNVPIGFLFGLGFDTTTEIRLLGASLHPGRARVVALDNPRVSRVVHGGHVADGYDRQRAG